MKSSPLNRASPPSFAWDRLNTRYPKGWKGCKSFWRYEDNKTGLFLSFSHSINVLSDSTLPLPSCPEVSSTSLTTDSSSESATTAPTFANSNPVGRSRLGFDIEEEDDDGKGRNLISMQQRKGGVEIGKHWRKRRKMA